MVDLDMEKTIDLDSPISRTYRFEEINQGFRLRLDRAVARGVTVLDRPMARRAAGDRARIPLDRLDRTAAIPI
jgi:hypothetical protein